MNGGLNLDSDGLEFVEVDPTGRYGRYHEILGKGAFKIVYRAFDEYEGIEVAWNQVKLYDFLQNPEDLERLYCEIHLLKTLKHKNIMNFHSSWVDTAQKNINFVTEMFTSGTLRQYRQKHRRVNIRAVKHWCRQILNGLLYLHSHDPPVIHRDLKCDNIFINGNQGEVKIGDLGLAAILRKSHVAHCVGTPEFMAPEVYQEEYNELADIYSFGMCLLEMVTFEYPYSECTGHVQIYNKVTSGIKPDALYKVKDPEVREFIEKCLTTVSSRLPARELLNDPFLQMDDYANGLRPIDFRSELDSLGPIIQQPLLEPCSSGSSYINESCIDLESYGEFGYQPIEMEATGIDLFDHHEDDHTSDVDITIKGKKREDGSIFLRLRIADTEGRIRNIYFPFDAELDTALSVATEMVAELDITDWDVTNIADMIDGEIITLVPDWKPGPGIEETKCESNLQLCQNCVSNHTSIGSFFDILSKNPEIHNSPHFQCANGCAAAVHGRFEEITCEPDESEHDDFEASEHEHASTPQPYGGEHAETLDRCKSFDFNTLASRVSNLNEELENPDKPISDQDKIMAETKNPNGLNHENSSKRLPRSHSSSMVPSQQNALTVDDEIEFQWELSSLKSNYDRKPGEFMDNSHNSSPCSPSPDRDKVEDNKLDDELLQLSGFNLSSQADNNGNTQSSLRKLLHQKSSPFSRMRRTRNGEAMEGSYRAHIFKSAKNFFSGSLLPNTCQPTTSLPVNSVFICNTKSVRYL